MPAFCVRPKRFPEGSVSSISAESGNAPAGPGAWVVVAHHAAAGDSNTESNEISMASRSCDSVSIEATFRGDPLPRAYGCSATRLSV